MSLRIFLVEDDSEDCELFQAALNEIDPSIQIECRSDCVDFVEKLEEFKPDLILLDLKMPHMDGAEALKEIRSHEWGKNIPVIILTNLGEEEAPKSLRTLGIHSYIVKADLTPRQVVGRAKEALGIA